VFGKAEQARAAEAWTVSAGPAENGPNLLTRQGMF